VGVFSPPVIDLDLLEEKNTSPCKLISRKGKKKNQKIEGEITFVGSGNCPLLLTTKNQCRAHAKQNILKKETSNGLRSLIVSFQRVERTGSEANGLSFLVIKCAMLFSVQNPKASVCCLDSE
jgi:hypothetical protein